MAKLSEDVRAELRFFTFYLFNSTLAYELLGELDYSEVYDSSSLMETVYSIWSNVLDVDENGAVLNGYEAGRRAAQFIRHMVDPAYVVDPPFADWELALPWGPRRG